jgi:hypothetical protein
LQTLSCPDWFDSRSEHLSAFHPENYSSKPNLQLLAAAMLGMLANHKMKTATEFIGFTSGIQFGSQPANTAIKGALACLNF